MSPVRLHRILGASAITHAVLVTVFHFSWLLRGGRSWTEMYLWVALATLWLLWPIVLLLRAERSFWRVVIPLFVSLVVLIPSIREYRTTAPLCFGLPPGVSLSPQSIAAYVIGYRAGRADAKKDLHSGRLVVEMYGFPMPGEFREILQQRYQIELRQTWGDVNVPEWITGHERGYNKISVAEITTRFGSGVIESAEEEAFKRHQNH
jgi:hypothetical protein